MTKRLGRFYDVENDPLDITARELANLLDSGLGSTEIDRLRFTRWRLRTHQLEGDGRPQTARRGVGEASRQVWRAGHRGPQ